MSKQLSEVRKQLGRSQADLAAQLEISQAQVSRYELDEGNIPYRLLQRWLLALGIAPQDYFSNPVDKVEPINCGKPHASLERNLGYLQDYIEAGAPAHEPKDDSTHKRMLEQLRGLMWFIGRKPVVQLAGAFDSGKSTIINTLLGRQSLPTGYQPKSWSIVYVRHIEDRPPWMNEEVCLLDEGFDPSKWDDEKHCNEHLEANGSLTILAEHGTYSDDGEDASAHYALVYVDSPILHGAILVDIPGYEAKDWDTQRAESNPLKPDVIIYASPSNGFLQGSDINRLGYYLNQLPDYETMDDHFPVLGGLFILSTFSDRRVSDKDLETIPRRAAQRVWDGLEETSIGDRANRIGRTIGIADIAARIYPFSLEVPERRRELEDALEELLCSSLPPIWKMRANGAIDGFRGKVKERYAQLIRHYQEVMERKDKACEDLVALKAQEPARQERVKALRSKVEARIEASEANALLHLHETFEHWTDTERLTKWIADRFSVEKYGSKGKAKKAAQENAAADIVELIQHRVSKNEEKLAISLSQEIKELLDSYEHAALDKENERIGLEYTDATDIFLGGVQGAAAAGALGLVVALKGFAMSGLAGMGITTTAGAAATVTAVAGALFPVIAVGAVLGFLAGVVFGLRDWKVRLAKAIVKGLEKQELKRKYAARMKKHWKNTKNAFRRGAKALEQRWKDYLDEYERICSGEMDRQELEELLENLEAERDFFAGIPWRSLTSEELKGETSQKRQLASAG